MLKPNPESDGVRRCGHWEMIRWSHEGGAHMNGFNALIKETPESSLAPSAL